MVEQIAERLLEEAGLSSWIDIWMLQGGADWERAISDALNACPSCAVFLGENGWGPFHRRESAAARRKAQDDPAFRVIPVLLPGFSEAALAEEAALFERWQRVDLSAGVDDNEGFRRLAAAIAGSEPFLDGRTQLTPTRIRRDAAQWRDASGRAKSSYLYSRHKLAEAEKQRREHATQFNEVAIQFLAASTDAARRRAVQWSAGLSVALILSVGLGWYAFKTAAERDEQRHQTQARQLASQSQQIRVRHAGQVDLGALLAVESHLRSPTAEGASALRRAVRLLPRWSFEGHLGPDSLLPIGTSPAPMKNLFGKTLETLFRDDASPGRAKSRAEPTLEDIHEAIDRIVDSVNQVLTTDQGDRFAVQATLYDEGDYQESQYLPRVILLIRRQGRLQEVDLRSGDGVEMSADGQWVAIRQDATNDVVVMEFAEPPSVRFSRRFEESIGTLRLSPDGGLIGVEGAGVLRVFRVRGGNQVAQLKWPEDTTNVAFSDDNKLVALMAGEASDRGVVYALDDEDGFELHSSGNVGALSPDGCFAATARSFANGAAALHGICGAQYADLGGQYATERMQLTSQARFLLSGEAGRAALEALPTEAPVWSGPDVHDAAISDEGHMLATSDGAGTLHLFQVQPPKEVGRIPTPSRIEAVAVAGDGRLVAALSEHGVSVFAVSPTAKTAEFAVTGGKRVALSSKGRHLAVAGTTLEVFDPAAQRRTVSGALTAVPEFLRFSNDERYLGLATRTEVRVIDTERGDEVFRQSGRAISALMFIQGDKYLEVLDGSTVTRYLWNPESLLESACARVSRKGLTCEEWDHYLIGEPYRPTCPTAVNREAGCSVF